MIPRAIKKSSALAPCELCDCPLARLASRNALLSLRRQEGRDQLFLPGRVGRHGLVFDMPFPVSGRDEGAIVGVVQAVEALAAIGEDLDIGYPAAEEPVPPRAQGAGDREYFAVVEAHEAAADEVDLDGVVAGHQDAAPAGVRGHGAFLLAGHDAVDQDELPPLGGVPHDAVLIGVDEYLVHVDDGARYRLVAVPASLQARVVEGDHFPGEDQRHARRPERQDAEQAVRCDHLFLEAHEGLLPPVAADVLVAALLGRPEPVVGQPVLGPVDADHVLQGAADAGLGVRLQLGHADHHVGVEDAGADAVLVLLPVVVPDHLVPAIVGDAELPAVGDDVVVLRVRLQVHDLVAQRVAGQLRDGDAPDLAGVAPHLHQVEDVDAHAVLPVIVGDLADAGGADDGVEVRLELGRVADGQLSPAL